MTEFGDLSEHAHVPCFTFHSSNGAKHVRCRVKGQDAADSEELQQALLVGLARLETLAVSMATHRVPLRIHQT